MLIDEYKWKGIKIKDVYFAKNILLEKNVDIIRYFQYFGPLPNDVIYKKFFTNIINLELSIDNIRANFRKSLKSEINQAIKKDNIYTKLICVPSFKEINEFAYLYNIFAKKKRLPKINLQKILRLYKNVCISYAFYENIILSYHLYLFSIDRVRLLYSGSNMNYQDHKMIAKANKLLHFEDIKFFKDRKFKIYDFGGVSLKNDNVSGIDKFKLAFSKNIEESYNFNMAFSLKGNLLNFLLNIKSYNFNMAFSLKGNLLNFLLNIRNRK